MAYAIKRGKSKAVARKIRHQRVRKHINGTPERPRLAAKIGRASCRERV